VLLLGAVVFIVWFITNQWDSFRYRIKAIEASQGEFKNDSTRIKTIEANQGDFKKDLNDFKNHLTRIDERLTRLERRFDQLILVLQSTKKMNVRLLESNSPLELTALGHKILVEMGGKQFVDMHLARLVKQIEEQNFKSPLDVQDYCSVVLNEFVNDDGFLPIKDYIFKMPMYKISDSNIIQMDLSVALSIMGIYLRNQFFKSSHFELNG
jgi:hypothetical protein